MAIVENIQRHNLNPIEEAKSFQQLMDEFQMSQEEVAQKMGKSRSVVANKIRLLKLPVEALKSLREGVITEGHAKAILFVEGLEKQRALLDLIIKNNWTVRQVESKTKEISVRPHRRLLSVDPEIKELEDRLSIAMGTKVRVTKAGGSGGRVIIDYYSNDELNKIISNLSVEKVAVAEVEDPEGLL
ncbi:MAG: ParB-like protein partition protein [Candidatus Moranbacteria bacterium GW2011_GWE2_35_164]|nr:MAG: ParB-like protein partition protein [Candidatus Moranbacteria bacterium GW2011_GWE2_35_164]